MILVRNVTDAKAQEIAGPEFGVNSKVEQREISKIAAKLQAYADCPDLS
jgi:hypothetical protein